jgi:hypothetical protein
MGWEMGDGRWIDSDSDSDYHQRARQGEVKARQVDIVDRIG